VSPQATSGLSLTLATGGPRGILNCLSRRGRAWAPEEKPAGWRQAPCCLREVMTGRQKTQDEEGNRSCPCACPPYRPGRALKHPMSFLVLRNRTIAHSLKHLGAHSNPSCFREEEMGAQRFHDISWVTLLPSESSHGAWVLSCTLPT
jgi:hypothetical protein